MPLVVARCVTLSLVLLAAPIASADPWLAPGESALRSDLHSLADAGVLRAPITTWPLPWAEIAADVKEADIANLGMADRAALERVRRRAGAETRIGEWAVDVQAAWAEDPTVMRSFERTPRDRGEVGGAVSRVDDRFAYRLRAVRVWNAVDGDTVRLDGSYVGMALGNWMLSAGYPERWWGPGWDGSLILSTNARPPPQLAINRNFATPFKQRWLHWIGPWTLSSFVARLDDERVIDDALLLGMRVTAKPLPQLEIGVSRTAQFCGDGRECNGKILANLLLGLENRGVNVAEDEEPGNQLGGFDARWALPFDRVPTALYLQWIGEDSRQGGPQIGSWLREIGVEFSGGIFSDRWRHRSYLELADTMCAEGGAGFGGEKVGCAYEHTIYQTGYRYKGRSIGHNIDGDGASLSVGSVLMSEEKEWGLSAKQTKLNRRGASGANTLSPVPVNVTEIAVSHSRSLRVGAIRASLGVRRSRGEVDSPTDDQSLFGWVEFVLP
jgi:Capsule assembly protein Wzi